MLFKLFSQLFMALFGQMLFGFRMADAETNWDAQAKNDSGLDDSVLPTYVLKKLLLPPEYYGDPSVFCIPGSIDKETGRTVRYVRYRPLPRPRSQAPNTQMSSPLSLQSDKVEATLGQWEAVTRFTTRANFYLGHPLFENALNKHHELYHRTGRLNIFDVLLAGTNVFYGSNKSGIAALTSSSKDVANRTKKIVAAFRRKGAMPPDGKNCYPAFCNPDVIDILSDDPNFINAESFQGRGMYEEQVAKFRGASWYPTNLLPIRQKLDDVTITDTSTGGSLSDDTYYIVTVAVNPLTGQDEYVTGIQTHTISGGTSTQLITVTAPASSTIELEPNTAYVYDVYIGTTNDVSSIYRISTISSDAAASISISSVPSSGITAPVAPASGVMVTPVIYMAQEGCGNTSSKLFPYGTFRPSVVSPKPTIGNDLGKLRSVGWSLDQKAVILNEDRIAILWIGYDAN